MRNDTWDIVDRPKDKNVIDSRFVLRNKFNPDNGKEVRKARIVARGFSQQYGADYTETFSPVARLSSIRLVTSLAVQRNWKMRQYDITTAYLNGILEEQIFMETPGYLKEVLEFIIKQKSDHNRNQAKQMLQALSAGDKVCHMKKALYGLKQAGRAWNKRLDEEIRNFGAVPSQADPCVYSKGQGENRLIIIVYVDDIIVA